jgi:hypothetical protein
MELILGKGKRAAVEADREVRTRLVKIITVEGDARIDAIAARLQRSRNEATALLIEVLSDHARDRYNDGVRDGRRSAILAPPLRRAA